MPRLNRPYVFLTLTAVAVLLATIGHGQDRGQLRSLLYPYTLPAVERGVILDVVRQAASDRPAASASPYSSDRVIVKFRDGMSTASRVRAMAAVSTTSSTPEQPSYANFDLVRIDPGEDAEAVAGALRQRPDVEYAQASYRVHKQMVPTDQYYKQYQWNLRLIDLERAWDIQPAGGSAIVVAVIDSGVAYRDVVVRFNGAQFTDDAGNVHAALGPVDVPFSAATDLNATGRFVAPHDFVWNDDVPLDLDGHGTHVSGTIGQLTNNNAFGTAGVAFNVKIMPVKVIAGDWDVIFGGAREPGGSDDGLARGIRYAADNGAKIINLSVGREGPANCGVNRNQNGCAPAVEDAIRYAVGKGAFISIAAGNDFETGNRTEVLSEIASRVAGAVSVAAVDPAKNHAYYSSTGSWVELAAPGGSDRGFGTEGLVLQQTYDQRFNVCIVEPRSCGVPPAFVAPRFDVIGFAFYEGTSMAAPHVSGLAAMLMQQGVTDPATIEAALEKFATDLGDPGRDPTFGFGLVEARATLRGLGLAK